MHGLWHRALMAAILVLVAIPANGCAGPFAAAWRTTEAVRQAGNHVDRALGAAATRKHAECVEVHGPKTEAYAVCIAKHWKALKVWRERTRPAVNSALIATVSALQLAERAKSDEEVDWLATIGPAACAITKVVRQWGHLMGDERDRIMRAIGAIQGVTCHD